MDFDLDQRRVNLSVGEFSAFTTGPRDSNGGPQGLWRAQLGTHWHNELRARAAEAVPTTEFEIPIVGSIFHQGWTFTLAGRIDQLVRSADDGAQIADTSLFPSKSEAARSIGTGVPPIVFGIPPVVSGKKDHPLPGSTGPRPTISITLREIKTVTRPLPTDEAELRAAYPEYFAQLAAYVALMRNASAAEPASPSPKPKLILRAELVFVEVASGLAQTLTLSPADETFFRVQLERVTEFLNLRLRARERLRHLSFRPAFAQPRPGQETTQADLTTTFERHPLVFFEAPTGFGKTGVLLEFALGQLRAGHFDRALYLTSKSTGQLQVVRTLTTMTAPAPTSSLPPAASKFPLFCPSPDPESPQEQCHVLRDTGLEEASKAGREHVAETSGSSEKKSATLNAQLVGTPVAVWHVRNKSEHCINHTFHCVRDNCAFLADAAARWPQSGLARFYLDEKHARDLPTLLAAGRSAGICPYEITRAALAHNDVWIGDYNYVFAPRNRGLFFEQPGFDAARTLLLLDEAHNLPSRVADAYSYAFTAIDAFSVREELHRLRPLASLVTAWDHWCHFLHTLRPTNALALDAEDDARHLLDNVAKLVRTVPLDLAALGPRAADALWQIPSLIDELAATDLPRLWWCPRDGELALTCLDAASAIGATLHEFGGVVLASATLTPVDGFATACGLADIKVGAVVPNHPELKRTPTASRINESPPPAPSSAPAAVTAPERLGALNKRDTRKLYRQLTSAAELLRVEETRDAARPTLLRAHTPWRDASYDVAFDARVDTTFQHRTQHYTTTAATIAALHAAAQRQPLEGAASSALQTSHGGTNTHGATRATPVSRSIAIFFPSYAYADAVRDELASFAPALRPAMQPRVRDLAAQSAWVEESLRSADALFLVLGSSFAESIDALGGRVTHAMVVGPALPEVNAVQRARLAEAARAGLSRDAAFRRVYQIPGMTKVNQALGRLVRAPGQRARVLLHCRRFLEPGYTSLLAPDYQVGTNIFSDADLSSWLSRPHGVGTQSNEMNAAV